MRKFAMIGLLMACLVPASASAEPTQGSAECRRLTSQINFFGERLGRAEELGNEMWEERLSNHLESLTESRAAKCPGYSDSDRAAEALAQLAQLAARGAITFFTMGAF